MSKKKKAPQKPIAINQRTPPLANDNVLPQSDNNKFIPLPITKMRKTK